MTTRGNGYEIWRDHVPAPLCQLAMRRFLLELRRVGVTAEQIAEFSSTTWWPTLRHDPEVLAIRDKLPLPYNAVWAEPQIVMRLPDEYAPGELVSHTDTEPSWALESDLRYGPIYGVMLTPSRPGEGTLAVWQNDLIEYLDMDIGDVVMMHPDLPHAGTLNMGENIRAAIYYRTLVPAT